MFTAEDLKIVSVLRKNLQRAIDEGYAEVVSWNKEHPKDLIWADIKFLTAKEIEQNISSIKD